VFQGSPPGPASLHQSQALQRALARGGSTPKDMRRWWTRRRGFLTRQEPALSRTQLAQDMQPRLGKAMDFGDCPRKICADRHPRHEPDFHARQGINPHKFHRSRTVFRGCTGRRANPCVSSVFFFRAGQNWGNKPYFSRATQRDSSRTAKWLGLVSSASFFYDTPAWRLRSLLLNEGLCPEGGRCLPKALLHPRRATKSKIRHSPYVARSGEDRGRGVCRNAQGTARAQPSRKCEPASALLGRRPPRLSVWTHRPQNASRFMTISHIQGRQNAGGRYDRRPVPKASQKAEYRKFNIKSARSDRGAMISP